MVFLHTTARDATAAYEAYWFQARPFLELAGYRLRPRFYPDIVATPNGSSARALDVDTCSLTHARDTLMDARRISDDKWVMLKRVSNTIHPHEVDIATFFSSPPHSDHPRNHCIPILGVLRDPDDAEHQIIVMPHCMAMYRPGFDTVGEVVDCLGQLFEGLQFIHENFVAHRDCQYMNIVQDPTGLFPQGFHPLEPWMDRRLERASRHTTRTQCWPRFYFIDFGLSRRYDPQAGPPLEDVIFAGDRTPPEHARPACNPFPTDVYFLGNLLKGQFLYVGMPWTTGSARKLHKPLAFLQSLAEDMTQEDPAARPTIGEVVWRFEELRRGLSSWHLRQPGRRLYLRHKILHRVRHLCHVLHGRPAAPKPAGRGPPPGLTEDMKAFYTRIPEDHLA
ncbi:hypothetical protein C8R47DRAFT_1171746 [Mycena vitilis]|nr:hypothetical protein C8R47DRAFT_1172500 [Mycena vitilis]KAJ6447774.1 hypothetical protein C8R47DRAFT_1172448 [Mycena vitilis]KAJ6449320.1 hypothetical protein C8R47DRAFT_1171746 [Mycena vitilis]